MNPSTMRTVLALLGAFLFSSAAHAQLFRAYLSSTGSDANPCTLAAPCRLVPAALAAVASNGEIWMLDSANYNTGPVQVTKSVTILAIPGEVGSLVAQAGLPAIIIATADVDVKLRNLAIVNSATNPGTNGVHMINGNSLTVEECLIANMPNTGISVSTAAKVSVSNSVIRNVGNGISASGGASVDVSDVSFSGIGIYGVVGRGAVADTTTRIAVSDSQFTSNHVGVYAYTTLSTATVRIVVIRSSVTLGDYGVASQVDAPGGVASVSASKSLLADLGAAFFQLGTGAVTESFGNNTVRNNGQPVSGTLTPVSSM